MALPLSPGLTPSEVAFLCEMEMVTVVPRQRLERLDLLGGPTLPLQPPHRAPLPLWLALLLKRQNRANIFPPPWLHPFALERILLLETKAEPEATKGAFTESPPLPRSPYGTIALSPPFVNNATAEADDRHLPYHWLEIGEILLEAASDDLFDAGSVRRLMRDLREVRMAKMRAGVNVLEGTGVLSLNGVGAMEVAEGRGFVSGVVDGLRQIGTSREQAIKEREAEEAEGEMDDGEDEDEYMGS